MKIGVILVNYNGKKYNTACIESILGAETEAEVTVYVVDNASSDGSMAVLEERYEGNTDLRCIYLDDNYGFSYANNAGIKKAMEQGCDVVFLLNNDTEICTDTLQRLLESNRRHPNCVIAPKIYYSDNRKVIWSAGGASSRIVKKVRHIGLNCEDKGQFDEEKRITFATGCALWIPVAIIQKAGLLDERFFLYYEDTEFCFRLGKYNVDIYYCPDAIVYHKVGASSKGADSPLCAYYISRNWLLCARKYMSGSRYVVFLLYYGINRMACSLLWLLQGKRDLVKASWTGIKDYKKKKTGKSRYY